MGFFLPQMAQMDTDFYSLNTNRTNCTNICIIREIRELQIGGRRESQIRVEINNPQNSDGIQTEENPCVSVQSVGYLFGGKDTAFGKSRFPSYRREITINKFTINNIF